jgi:ABC-type phosphate transport system substrate-binding protein
MKRVRLAVVAIALLAFGTVSRAAPDELAVIVNKSNPISTLTIFQLRRIVLAEQEKWPSGSRIIVWMSPPGQPDRAGALKMVCGMTETDFTLYFVHASFNRDPPRTVASSGLVKKSIAGAFNGVGFIWASEMDDSVKVLAIDGSLPGQPAYKLRMK